MPNLERDHVTGERSATAAYRQGVGWDTRYDPFDVTASVLESSWPTDPKWVVIAHFAGMPTIAIESAALGHISTGAALALLSGFHSNLNVRCIRSESGETWLPSFEKYPNGAIQLHRPIDATTLLSREYHKLDSEPLFDENVVRKFDDLAAQWCRERDRFDSGTAMFTHPAYQQIIGLGQAVLPLIMRRLERELDHWFWALKAIAGVDPVPDKWKGNLELMREAWLRWAKRQGVRW